VLCNCLYKLLPTLKPDYAEVIWRADIVGEPRDRIAASLGITSPFTRAPRLSARRVGHDSQSNFDDFQIEALRGATRLPVTTLGRLEF
jgi:hypothetical protein